MNLLILPFLFFIVLIIFFRINEILKEKRMKEEREEETTTGTTIELTEVAAEITEEPTKKRSLWEKFSGSYWEVLFWIIVLPPSLYILIFT